MALRGPMMAPTSLRRIQPVPLPLAAWASTPGEYGLLEMGHPGGQAAQRQLAELVDDGGGRSVHMAAQQRQAEDRRGRFRDAQELGGRSKSASGIT